MRFDFPAIASPMECRIVMPLSGASRRFVEVDDGAGCIFGEPCRLDRSWPVDAVREYRRSSPRDGASLHGPAIPSVTERFMSKSPAYSSNRSFHLSCTIPALKDGPRTFPAAGSAGVVMKATRRDQTDSGNDARRRASGRLERHGASGRWQSTWRRLWCRCAGLFFRQFPHRPGGPSMATVGGAARVCGTRRGSQGRKD